MKKPDKTRTIKKLSTKKRGRPVSKTAPLSLALLPGLLTSLLFGYANLSFADGYSIGKVYDPYVNALEKELEYRMHYDKLDSDTPNVTTHYLGYGQSLNDRIFVEAYLVASDVNGEPIEIEGHELELKWQLTEQGEYSADYGLLFELEREDHGEEWEAATALLIAKDWRKTSLLANLKAIYEWGDEIDNEWETSASFQYKYRYKRELEPMLELHLGEDTAAFGPMLGGLVRTGGMNKLYWYAGVLAGLKDKTPDVIFKGGVEFEF